jgi:hypothetical protein
MANCQGYSQNMDFVKQALRVLIVDDSNDDATLLLHTLRIGGYDLFAPMNKRLGLGLHRDFK